MSQSISVPFVFRLQTKSPLGCRQKASGRNWIDLQTIRAPERVTRQRQPSWWLKCLPQVLCTAIRLNTRQVRGTLVSPKITSSQPDTERQAVVWTIQAPPPDPQVAGSKLPMHHCLHHTERRCMSHTDHLPLSTDHVCGGRGRETFVLV